MKNFKKVRLQRLNYPKDFLGYLVPYVNYKYPRTLSKNSPYVALNYPNNSNNYPRVLLYTKYPKNTPPYIYRGC